MSDRPGSPIQRVAQRLRNISQLSTQIANVEIEDAKVARIWPENMRVIADSLVDAGETLKRYASEVSAYTNRRQEDTDALVTLAQTAANISTVLGSDGSNLKILTHSDPAFVLSVLIEATEDARREAVSMMPVEERQGWLGQLSLGGLVRLAALIEELPEGPLKEAQKAELAALMPPEFKGKSQ